MQVSGSAPRRAAGVTYEVVDGQAVVLDPDGRELITLNEVGTLIWQHLDGNCSVPDLVEALLPNFEGVTRQEFEGDVVAYVAELRAAGLVDGATDA